MLQEVGRLVSECAAASRRFLAGPKLCRCHDGSGFLYRIQALPLVRVVSYRCLDCAREWDVILDWPVRFQ